DAEDNRDRRGRSFGYLCSIIACGRGDNGHATTHEVSHERRKAIELTLQPVVLHRHVLALDVAGFVEALAERGGKGRIGRPADDECDNSRCRLLPARRERPRRRAAEKRDELASLHLRGHSMTSSAMAISLSGIWRPSAFAVLRLMTSSYLVGACTGRSAGFSPLRMRST